MDNQKSILIADDNKEHLKLLSEILKHEGYKVRLAMDGLQAIEIIEKESPSLILVEEYLPELDGYEICKIIKDKEKLKNIPILFIVTLIEQFNKSLAFDTGSADYITKPFEKKEVLSRVKVHYNLYNSQKKLENVNVELLQQLDSSFKQAAIGIVHIEIKTRKIVKANKKICNFLGYNTSELIGKTIEDITHPDYIDEDKLDIRYLIEGKLKSLVKDKPYVHKDGKIVWGRITVTLVETGEKNIPNYFVGFLEDITELKRTTIALRESEEINRITLSNISDAVFLTDNLGKFKYICTNVHILFGYDKDEVSAMGNISKILGENFFSLSELNEKGELKNIDRIVLDKSGCEHDILLNIKKVNIKGGTVLYSCRDITERKQVEEQLRTTQMHYADFINTSSDAVSYWEVSPEFDVEIPTDKQVELLYESVCVDANKALWETYGFKRKESVIGKKYNELNAENTINNIFLTFIKSNYSLHNVEKVDKLENGETIYLLESWYGVVKDNILKNIWIISNNITEQRKAEAALKKNEEILNVAQKIGKFGAWDWEKNRDKMWWSDGMYQIFGLKKQDFVPQMDAILKFYIHPTKEQTKRFNLLEQLKSTRKEESAEHEFYKPDGSLGIFYSTVQPYFNEVGELVRVIGTAVDITEKKNAEAEIFKQSNRRQLILDTMQDGYIYADKEGYIRDVNPAYCKLVGYSREELLSMNIRKMDAKISPEEMGKFIQHLAKSGKAHFETLHKHKNGSLIDLEVSISVMQIDGEVMVSAFVRDITDRKKAESKIQKLNKELEERVKQRTKELELEKLFTESILDAIPGIFYTTDEKRRIVRWNKNLLDLTGYSEKELAGIISDDLISVKDMKALIERRKETNEQGYTELEVDIVSKSGKHIPYFLTGKRFLQQDKTYTVGTGFDLSDLKNTQNALKESEAKFRELSELLPQAIFETDVKGNITYTNNYGYESTGYTPKDIEQGLNVLNLISPEDHSRIKKNFQRRILGELEGTNEYTFITKKGKEVPILIYSSPIIKNKKTTGLRGIIVNISERKKAEEEIRLFKMFADASGEGFGMAELDGSIIYHNQQLNKLLDEKETPYNEKIFKYFNKENLKFLNKVILSQVMKTGQWQGEVSLLTAKGHLFPIYFNFYVIKDKKGDPFRLAAVVTDITKRKKLEYDLKVAKETADIANRAKSEFLANMSHEIRTPMNAVIGFAHILSKQVKDPVQKDYLDSIRSSGKILLHIINDILDLSKIEAGKLELQPAPTNLADILKEMKALFELRVMEKNLKFELVICKKIPKYIVIDELRIKQILINLISNAIKFTEKGKIGLSVRCMNNSNNKIDIILSVTDTGIGIAEEDQEKIFNAFSQKEGQSTKKYGGTGLGLAITNKLVNLLGGNLLLDSEIGKGSTFSFTLRRLEIYEGEYDTSKKYDYLPEEIQFKGSKVLIVDDIESNRKLLKSYLLDYDLEILEAANGQEGLDMCKVEKPDIVFMDLRMPVMGGYEALKCIRENDELKSIPVIAITASILTEIENIPKSRGFSRFLRKPIELMDIVDVLIKYLPYSKITTSTKVKTDEYSLGFASVTLTKEVIDLLLNEINPMLETITKLKSNKVIRKIARQIINIGDNQDVEFFKYFGNELLTSLTSFNIEKTERMINSLNDFMQKIGEK